MSLFDDIESVLAKVGSKLVTDYDPDILRQLKGIKRQLEEQDFDANKIPFVIAQQGTGSKSKAPLVPLKNDKAIEIHHVFIVCSGIYEMHINAEPFRKNKYLIGSKVMVPQYDHIHWQGSPLWITEKNQWLEYTCYDKESTELNCLVMVIGAYV